jgi:hypothetical protein
MSDEPDPDRAAHIGSGTGRFATAWSRAVADASVSTVLAAVLGSLATIVLGQLMAIVEMRRRDQQVRERDEDLEEWILDADRRLKNRWMEIEEQAAEAGVALGGTPAKGRAVAAALILNGYREQSRQARTSVARIGLEERWTLDDILPTSQRLQLNGT